MILIDSREQLAIFSSTYYITQTQKLGEGDYTTDNLLNYAHAERKSGIDLYGSIIQGHDRFVRELVRAADKNIKLVVFVECTKPQFISKKFKGGYRLKCKPKVLAKILATMQTKYCFDIIWCEGRDEMEYQMSWWFSEMTKKKSDDEARERQEFIDRSEYVLVD